MKTDDPEANELKVKAGEPNVLTPGTTWAEVMRKSVPIGGYGTKLDSPVYEPLTSMVWRGHAMLYLPTFNPRDDGKARG